MIVRFSQPSNAVLPIKVTLAGMVMEVKPVQLKKALTPIEVTPFGMVMERKLSQFPNNTSLIDVIA